MKKTILILALALLVLSGCSGKKSEPTEAPTQAAAVTEPGAVITLPAEKPAPAPTVPPTTAPAPAPTAAPTVPAAIVITKHPTSETVSAGAGTWFIAKAENQTQITWEFFSPDGTMYSLQQAMSAHPGLVLEVLPEDTLALRQIPASFSGWSARARYDGPGGTAVTDRAAITVRDPYGEIIERYRGVHRTGSGNIEKGISELVSPNEFLGYAKKDLDGNGVQELILASDENALYPNVVYEVYTLRDGKAVSVAQSFARSRYFLLYDGRFLMEGSGGAMYSSRITYRFQGEDLSVSEKVWTSDIPHDMADFAPYYYYSSPPYVEGEPMVYDQAARLIESWELAVTALDLTPIN